MQTTSFAIDPVWKTPTATAPSAIAYSKTPKGMSINLVDGTLRWEPDKAQAGLHTIRLEVDDRKGGRAEQSLEVHVAFERVPSPAARPR